MPSLWPVSRVGSGLRECGANSFFMIHKSVVQSDNQGSSGPLASPEEIYSIKGCIWSVWRADLVSPAPIHGLLVRPAQTRLMCENRTRHEYRLKQCGFLHWAGHYD
jgi:hypothetical protein